MNLYEFEDSLFYVESEPALLSETLSLEKKKSCKW